MKKIYILLLFVLPFAFLRAQNCTPDPIYANSPGIYPDTTTNFLAGYTNTAYNQNITITVPQDTTPPFPPIPIPFDSVHLVSMSNLPPGLTYMCSPGNCTWLGGTSGCAAIYGTPTTAGLYNLNIVVNAYLAGSTTPQVQNVNGYRINITAPTGINEAANISFEVMQNQPNPAGDKTMIRFKSPTEEKVKIQIFNALGKVVADKKIDAARGVNEVEADTRSFASGIYFYTVEYKGKTVTRKMMVARN